MSNSVENSRFQQYKGPIFCAIGGLFTMTALAYAIHVSSYPSPASQVQFVWGCLLITAPIGFFFLSLGLRYLLQERSR